MEVDGKNWCPVHAPLEDENGNLTKKGNWNDVEIKRFYAEIPMPDKNAPIAPIMAAIPISPNIIPPTANQPTPTHDKRIPIIIAFSISRSKPR